jgi:hypothetical protein
LPTAFFTAFLKRKIPPLCFSRRKSLPDAVYTEQAGTLVIRVRVRSSAVAEPATLTMMAASGQAYQPVEKLLASATIRRSGFRRGDDATRRQIGGQGMAMGKRGTERQQDLFVMHDKLPKSPGHVFYIKLNRLLAEAEFDAWVEALCEPYYADSRGRPSVPPGVYFRMLIVGYFEGISSQRGIAWR